MGENVCGGKRKRRRIDHSRCACHCFSHGNALHDGQRNALNLLVNV